MEGDTRTERAAVHYTEHSKSQRWLVSLYPRALAFLLIVEVASDEICTKLQQNNVMTVARRSVEGQELLYHSIKYTNNIFVLSELKIHQATTALTVSAPSLCFPVIVAHFPSFQLSLKSRHLPAVANMNEMFQLILSN